MIFHFIKTKDRVDSDAYHGIYSNGTHVFVKIQKSVVKKMFNSCVYVSMDNDTMETSEGNLVYKFPYFRKYSEITNTSFTQQATIW